MPCHLALRTCLESESVSQAVAALERVGVASACHILVGDANGAVGLECSHADLVTLPVEIGMLAHTNHYVRPHEVEDRLVFEDSPVRLARIEDLVQEQNKTHKGSEAFNVEVVRSFFADEKNSPTAICRSKAKGSTVATLFNIVMDLREKKAEVILGKPTQLRRAEDISFISP